VTNRMVAPPAVPAAHMCRRRPGHFLGPAHLWVLPRPHDRHTPGLCTGGAQPAASHPPSQLCHANLMDRQLQHACAAAAAAAAAPTLQQGGGGSTLARPLPPPPPRAHPPPPYLPTPPTQTPRHRRRRKPVSPGAPAAGPPPSSRQI
jgi:hypothetical protein